MSEQRTLSRRATAELGLLGLIWGTSFLSVHFALVEIPVLTVVLHRTGWAALALWAVVLALRLAVPRDPRIWAAFLVMGVANNVIPFGLQTWAQTHIETGLISILNATTAIFGVVVAALVFADERLTLRKALGTAIGFGGVVTVVGPEAITGFDPRNLAQLGVLGATLSYALAGAFARRHLGRLHPLVAAAGMLTGATVVLMPLALAFEGPVRLDLMPQTWGAIAYYSLIATAGAFLLYYRVLAMAGSGNLMLVTLLVPPLAIVLGALVLGESLTPRAYAGLVLLAAGLMVLNGTIRLPVRARPIDPVRGPE